MKAKISSNMKFFKLYIRRRETRSWDNIRTFRFVISQSTAKIFLAHDYTGGIHSASVMRVAYAEGLRKKVWGPCKTHLLLPCGLGFRSFTSTTHPIDELGLSCCKCRWRVRVSTRHAWCRGSPRRVWRQSGLS